MSCPPPPLSIPPPPMGINRKNKTIKFDESTWTWVVKDKTQWERDYEKALKELGVMQ